MLKKISVFLIITILCLNVCGCGSKSETTTTKGYTFSVDTGDSVKIILDTTDNYDLSSELPFTVSKDGETLSQGSFAAGSDYSKYETVVNEDPAAEILDSGEKDGNEYIFWCYNGTEYNYALHVGESNTAIIIGNAISEESAKECFERLTITLE